MAVAGDTIAAGEDKLPLFNLQAGVNGTRRRVFAGFIPVARQQAYAAGVALRADPSGNILPQVADDPRLIDFQRQVLDPWVDLMQWAATVKPAPSTGPVATITDTSMAAAQGSAFILIDFANYLDNNNLKDVLNAVQNGSPGSLTGDKLRLYNALNATLGNVQDGARYTLSQAIVILVAGLRGENVLLPSVAVIEPHVRRGDHAG